MTARIIQPAEARSSVPLTRLRGVTLRLHAVTLHLREAIRRHRIVLLLRVPIRRRAILPHQATLPAADLTVEETAAATRAARLTAADHL